MIAKRLLHGRWIVEHGSLPASEPFAIESADGGLVNVPWLAQLAGYLTFRTLGSEGLVLAHALLGTASCGILMLAIRRRQIPLACCVALGAIAMLLSLPVLGTIRPQLLGMLGVPLVLAYLARPPRGWLACWILALLFAVWANTHGSFAVGLLLLGLGLVTTSCEVGWERKSFADVWRRAEPRWLAAGLLFAVIGSCLNPLGPRLLLEVASFGQHAPLAAISEWRSLSPWSLSGVLFYGSLLATAIILRVAGRRMQLLEMVLLVVFGLLTMTAMRMLVWWALIWPWVVAPHAWAAWQRVFAAAPAPDDSTPRAASMRTLIGVSFVFMTLLLAPPSQALLRGQPRGEARVTGQGTPWYVADELVRRQAEGNLLAPMDWADYLVWKTEGRVRPLVYSHVHLLPESVWTDYQRIEAGAPDWPRLARAHQLKFLVVDRKRNTELLRQVMLASRHENPPVRVIYRDKRCILAEVL